MGPERVELLSSRESEPWRIVASSEPRAYPSGQIADLSPPPTGIFRG